MSELGVVCDLDAAFLFDLGFFLLHDVKDNLAAAAIADIHQLDIFDGLDTPILQLRLYRLGKIISEFGAYLQDVLKHAARKDRTNRALDDIGKLVIQILKIIDALCS